MKQVILIHGYNGKEMAHWMLWLEEQLKDLHISTFFLPIKAQKNQKWMNIENFILIS